MLNATNFRDLASGRRKGLVASVMRAGLGAAEIPYALYMRRRNRRYDCGRLPIERAGVPVISVGNLTVGGTGKTPFVAWLARWFRRTGRRVSIISRGYGAEAGAQNDEALELERSLPDVPHLQNPDRVEAAQIAVEELETELILLDDAFQHRRMHRDLDIVLLDALEPFGYRHLLPRGLLREPISSLARAQVVCLSRADLVDEASRKVIHAEVTRHAPNAALVELAHRPAALVSWTGDATPLEVAAGKRVAAFCGIGNPSGFRKTLEHLGYEISDWREFPDHHRYTRDDVAALSTWAAQCHADVAICTQKDLVKLQISRLGDIPLFAMQIGIDVLTGLAELEAALGQVERLISSPAPDDGPAP